MTNHYPVSGVAFRQPLVPDSVVPSFTKRTTACLAKTISTFKDNSLNTFNSHRVIIESSGICCQLGTVGMDKAGSDLQLKQRRTMPIDESVRCATAAWTP